MGNDCQPQQLWFSASTIKFLDPADLDGSVHDFYKRVCSHFSDHLQLKYQRKYTIKNKELGRGSVGVVMECLENRTKQLYAVKSIPKKDKSDADLQCLRFEVLALKYLSHPYIIQLEDVFEDESSINLVFPLCAGGTLLQRMVNRLNSPMKTHTETETLHIIQHILEAVDCCHKRGIIHRDLKPENFIFESESKDSQMMLCDFGLSIFQSDVAKGMGKKVGSPYYMAPEVVKNLKVTCKCDLWSVGIIFYMLLAGTMPFKSTTLDSLFEEIANEEPISFEGNIWAGVSNSVLDLIKSLLDKKPSRRLSAKSALAHPCFKPRANALKS